MNAPGSDDGLDRQATWLAGSFATITAILAALGAVNGGMERMLRNYKTLALVAFLFTVSAIPLAVLALGERRRRQRFLLILSVFVFAVGLVTVTYTAVITPSVEERPSIVATLKNEGGGPVVEVTIKASSVKATAHVYTVIQGLVEQQSGPTTTYHPRDLYRSRTGPDAAGVVDLSLHVPLAAGSYDDVAVSAWVGEAPQPCTLDKVIDGCVTLRMPQAVARPQLSASWQKAGTPGQTLTVRIKARDIRADRAVSLRVIAASAHAVKKSLYFSFLAPDPNGTVDSTAEIPVSAHFDRVCVATATLTLQAPSERKAPGCPPTATTSTVWALLAVPKS
jgi:hypothetical protein